METEFHSGRASGLKFVKRALERRSGGPDAHWRGNVLLLDLDRVTNLVTVSLQFGTKVEPEVVDYDEFKRFVLRERP